jgi:glucose-fructose oxidoreductase
MDPAYEMVGDLKSEIMIGGKSKRKIYPKRDQFSAELVYFSSCILEDTDPEPGGREGLADVRIVNAILESQSSGATSETLPRRCREAPVRRTRNPQARRREAGIGERCGPVEVGSRDYKFV